jgi:hypothetical protein
MDAKRFPIQFSEPEKKWRVNVPASLSSSGKRERHFFDKKQQAQSFVSGEAIGSLAKTPMTSSTISTSRALEIDAFTSTAQWNDFIFGMPPAAGAVDAAGR